ncbi:MAG: hypothetical protein Ct9H300mP28_16590 [Pseudomonadota bacterium]|nr:MAG: hypothetical protein Ct9H300mP28_16590 [Pseudomonadota bacterium]
MMSAQLTSQINRLLSSAFNQSLLQHLRNEESTLFMTGKTADEKTLVGNIIHPDTLWACTTCRACEEACPVSIEHVPRIIGMRQNQTMMEEAYPPEMANTFKGLERNFNPWGIGFDQRADWAEGMEIPLMSERNSGNEGQSEEIDVLMWVGCAGSYDSRNQKIARATATLYQKAGVKLLYWVAKRNARETLHVVQEMKCSSRCWQVKMWKHLITTTSRKLSPHVLTALIQLKMNILSLVVNMKYFIILSSFNNWSMKDDCR